MLSTLQKKKITRLFNVFDANKNGHLDMNDVIIITQKFTKEFGWDVGGNADRNFKSAFLKVWTKMFRLADFNNDKKVTLEEFLEHFENITQNDSSYYVFIKPMFDELFEAIDTNKDGLLSKEEYQAMFKVWGNSQVEAEKVFTYLDANKDGAISHFELYSMFYKFFMETNPKDKSKLFFGPID